MAVILETSLGDICIDLFTDERPRCCLNFLKLCKMKYFNFHTFHSVQKGLAAQTGDPEETGRGGQSIYGLLYGDQANYFESELKPRIKHLKRGTVSMVNNGQNMHGSQFFITLSDSLDSLDSQGHTVFGEVSEGFDTLDKLNEVYCDEDHKPFQNIRIYHTVILDDPYDDPKGLEVPDKSPEPDRKKLDNGRIEATDEIDPYKGMTEEEVQEMIEAKEAKANAQILEMVGDLPDQDAAPEENVLFVCKLNGVTTDEDLEIIFSRFGPIKSCEVVRDHKTGDSLQYAFVEFGKKEHCEAAYFKMDNVLIDDRRIHVDFSQSVAHLKWKGKGKGVEKIPDKGAEKRMPQLYGTGFDVYSGDKKTKGRDRKGKGRHTDDQHDRRLDSNKQRKGEDSRMKSRHYRRSDTPEHGGSHKQRSDTPEHRGHHRQASAERRRADKTHGWSSSSERDRRQDYQKERKGSTHSSYKCRPDSNEVEEDKYSRQRRSPQFRENKSNRHQRDRLRHSRSRSLDRQVRSRSRSYDDRQRRQEVSDRDKGGARRDKHVRGSPGKLKYGQDSRNRLRSASRERDRHRRSPMDRDRGRDRTRAMRT